MIGFLRWRRVKITIIGSTIVASFLFVLLMNCQRSESERGCVNQGSDCRKFPAIICCLQRHMSWNSEHEPHFFMIGRPDRTNISIAWPPYLVFNTLGKEGDWFMFRIGFRYDRNWHGYIFPTVACKNVDRPLRY